MVATRTTFNFSKLKICGGTQIYRNPWNQHVEYMDGVNNGNLSFVMGGVGRLWGGTQNYRFLWLLGGLALPWSLCFWSCIIWDCWWYNQQTRWLECIWLGMVQVNVKGDAVDYPKPRLFIDFRERAQTTGSDYPWYVNISVRTRLIVHPLHLALQVSLG